MVKKEIVARRGTVQLGSGVPGTRIALTRTQFSPGYQQEYLTLEHLNTCSLLTIPKLYLTI